MSTHLDLIQQMYNILVLSMSSRTLSTQQNLQCWNPGVKDF